MSTTGPPTPQDDDQVAFGFPEEWVDFKKRNPAFHRIVPALSETIQKVFGRSETLRGTADKVIFNLGNVCAEDFLEIFLLCANGYGIGGMKLLRGLYERAVTVGYLVNQPSEAEAFLAYGDVHRGKQLNHARKVFDMANLLKPELIREIDEGYQAAKPKFQETLCEKCGTTRDMASWTKLSTEALAHKANPPGTKKGIEQLYLPCFFDPTMQVHATVFSLISRFDPTKEGISFDTGPQRAKADLTMMSAHNVLLAVMEMQNRHFKLGMDDEIEARRQDFIAAWTKVTPEP